MEFCPDCGMRLVSRREKKAKKAVFHLVCPKCGYSKDGGDKPSVVPKTIEIKDLYYSYPDGTSALNGVSFEIKGKESIAIIGREEQKLRTLPTVRIECPKCGNNTAYAWQVQTRGTDESSTQFFRCTKCGHTFREYS